jgi:hypothetical protein
MSQRRGILSRCEMTLWMVAERCCDKPAFAPVDHLGYQHG